MRFVIISDTHGLHKELVLPKGDVLIHAGDISDFGNKEEIIDFLNWFSQLPYAHKVFIGGNHDIFLDEYPVDLLEFMPQNVVYLNNKAYEIDQLKLWGSPATPDFVGWAFGKEREEMEAHWRHLPQDIDILITHTPPYGILDKSTKGYHLGCEKLLEKVKERKPKYHLFGHIHASYGILKTAETTFINASNLNSYLGLVNPPIVFDW